MGSLLEILRSAVGPLLEVNEADESFVVQLRRPGPWWIRLDKVDEGMVASLVVRTTSSTFGGDRSDLHEALSLLMACHLSAEGHSAALVDVPNGFVPGEIEARFVIQTQPHLICADDQIGENVRSLAGRLLVATQTLPLCLGMTGPAASGDSGCESEELSAWAATARRALSVKPGGLDLLRWRTNPTWFYLRAHRADTRVLRAPVLAAAIGAILADIVRERDVLNDAHGKLIRQGSSRHYIPTALERRARRLMTALGCESVELVPLENCLLVVGAEHVALFASGAGAQAYELKRREMVERHEQATSFLYGSRQFEWASATDAGRFEQLVRELLALEPGVSRVRSAGAVNDRDQGRDLVIDLVHPQLDRSVGVDEVPAYGQRIVGQCKVRGGGVGKHDVQDIFDTVQRHDAAGYFLAVSTHLTSDLVAFLDLLRSTRKMECDWWDRSEIEHRLRQHPNVLARFADVVVATESTDE